MMDHTLKAIASPYLHNRNMDLSNNASPLLIFFCSTALGVSTIAIALRCYVRIRIQKVFSADDYLLVLGHVFYAAYLGCALEAVKYGVGKHVWDATNLTKALMVCDSLFSYVAVLKNRAVDLDKSIPLDRRSSHFETIHCHVFLLPAAAALSS